MQPAAALLAYWYSVREAQGQSLIAQPGAVISQQITAVLTIDRPILATSSPSIAATVTRRRLIFAHARRPCLSACFWFLFPSHFSSLRMVLKHATMTSIT